MKTFLFVWNPKKWEWKDLEQTISKIKIKGKATEDWSVASHKKISPGDRAFLFRLGEEPKGIVGSGYVSSHVFLAKHWSGENKTIHMVDIEFDVLLNVEQEPILSLDLLKQGDLSRINWTPQASGIEIQKEFTKELEGLWFDFLTTQNIRTNPFINSESDNHQVFTEGTPNQVLVTKYERNPFARQTCIDHYGLSCQVCDFNFEERFGELGQNFIHVHHLNQISSIGGQYQVDPIKDLRPVCPNCHAMLHKRKEPYTIEELKEFISINSLH
ncbi:HNH endonuclease [Pontibacter vulgaris]|uniref:HNH endonuclease n=1 Tax=Pontibacter vulgaris TaxID=2905679 RepID=UPI001FA78AC4|nr:HNH endonuclease [Pontibacter vulgaris]